MPALEIPKGRGAGRVAFKAIEAAVREKVYAGWTLKRFLNSPRFRWTASRAADWRTPWPGWRPTRYEAKARRAGRASVYLTFVRK